MLFLLCLADDTSSNKNSNRDHTTTVTAAVAGKPSIAPTLPTLAPTISTISNVPSVQESLEPSCDSYGVCYEVALKCTDTKIVVNVQTSRPFHGRIYALGRSETCNLNVRNNQQFTLDISLGGQDCNTQSMVSDPNGSVA